VTQANDGKKEKGALRVDQNQLINQEGFSFSGYERDPLYLNLGDRGERRFVDVSGVSGIDSITDGRAGVFADFDNDGDLDVFMTTIQGQTHLLFRNNIGQANNSLRVMLEGAAKRGRDAYGAVVRVKTSAGTLTKIKNGGMGFISAHDPRLLFGLGKDAQAESVEVTWPGGKVERFTGETRAGTTIVLREGAGRIETATTGRAKLPDPLTRAEVFARGLKMTIGQPLPDLPVKTLSGEATTLAKQLRPGRRTLINVWATWCVPCAREMPELERLRLPLDARGIDLLGVNVDTEPKADIKGFLRDHPVRYTVLVGGLPLVERLFTTDDLSVPLSIIVDERGVVSELIPGWSNETQRRFAELVKPK
jgi:thiol-disulfide isomerase/thioredoxin